MPHMGRQHEHLALTNGNVVDRSSAGDLQDDVTAQLIEELLDRVVVEVHALVGAAYDLDLRCSRTPSYCRPGVSVDAGWPRSTSGSGTP